MKVLRAYGRVSNPLSALLLALVAACATHSGAPPGRVSTATTPAEPELRVGEPIERELASGETQTYRVEVPPGSYLRIVAEPRAMDVALALLAPDRTVLASADGPGGSKLRELLSLVTATGGSCLLTVERKDEGDPRRYSLRLEELRPAISSDDARARAERLFTEGMHLQALDVAEAREQALARFQESQALWQELGDKTGQVECLNQAGLAHYSQGKVEEAIALYERALALAQAAAHRNGEGEALNNLGLAYSRRGEPQKTLDYYQRALAVWREIGNAAEAARTLHNLGVFDFERGEPRQALEKFEEALPLWRAGGDLAGEANSLSVIGALYFIYLGESKPALEHLYRALPLSKTAGSLSTEAYVTGILAAAHRTRGELQQALQLYGEAIALWERFGDPTNVGNIREALAGLYLDLGEGERAAEEYRRVLEVYRTAKNRDYEARVLNSIGWLHSLAGDPLAALSHYGEALSISRETGNMRVQGIALHRIGIARAALGELPAALASLQESLALRREVGNRSEEASTLLDLAVVEHKLGREGAVQQLEQALALARRAENAPLQATIQLRAAGLDRDSGDLDRARVRLEEALAIVESVRQQVASRDLRATYFAAKREYYDAYIDLLMRLEGRSPGEKFAERAFEASERARARSLLELLAEGRIDVRRGIAPDLREREHELASRIASAQNRLVDLLSKGSAEAAPVGALKGELEAALEQRQQLESEVRARHPRYAEVRYPAVMDLVQLQKSLRPGNALLEYALGADASYLFVVTREEFRAHRLPPEREISGEVEQLRRVFVAPERRSFGRYLLSAHRLYETLLAPAEATLKGHPELIVVADGPLHLLPFEALVPSLPDQRGQPAAPRYVLHTHAISYLPSASVLLGLRAARTGFEAETNPRKGLVAFADPLLPATARRSEEEVASFEPTLAMFGFGGSFAALPQSRREVESIAGLFAPSDVDVFVGARATEENAKRQGVLSGARRIHFATHAFLSEVRPELSGLVLAHSRESGEDGLLQVYEVFNLELHSEMVVLSACQSGLGKGVPGEGLVGLARAFLYAGTPSLIVSLWPVNDASTADLMIEFYRRLNQGENRGAALRDAKLHALAGKEFEHPFYWAPFVLLGEA